MLSMTGEKLQHLVVSKNEPSPPCRFHPRMPRGNDADLVGFLHGWEAVRDDDHRHALLCHQIVDGNPRCSIWAQLSRTFIVIYFLLKKTLQNIKSFWQTTECLDGTLQIVCVGHRAPYLCIYIYIYTHKYKYIQLLLLNSIYLNWYIYIYNNKFANIVWTLKGF